PALMLLAVATMAGCATVTALVAAVVAHRRHKGAHRTIALLAAGLTGYAALLAVAAEYSVAARVVAAMTPTPVWYLLAGTLLVACAAVTAVLARHIWSRKSTCRGGMPGDPPA